MWTTADRQRYGREGQRYPSDLTDAEWALAAPLIRPAKRGGRRRSVVVREVMDGLLYVLETGCQWRHLPRDLPPRSTVHGYLQRWDWDGTPEAVHYQLYVACGRVAGIDRTSAASPAPPGFRRCGRRSGVPAPACGSGHGRRRPLRSPDAGPCGSAVRHRSPV